MDGTSEARPLNDPQIEQITLRGKTLLELVAVLIFETCVSICLGLDSSVVLLNCFQLVLTTDYKPHEVLTNGFERSLIAIV